MKLTDEVLRRDAFEAYYLHKRGGRGVKRREGTTLERMRTEPQCYVDEATQRHWWTWQNAVRAVLEPQAVPSGGEEC